MDIKMEGRKQQVRDNKPSAANQSKSSTEYSVSSKASNSQTWKL